MPGGNRHGSFVATGMLPKADLAKLNAEVEDKNDGGDHDDSSNHSTGSAPPPSTHRDRDVLSQSTPVIPSANKSSYPTILLYKTKMGSIMRYSTLDDSIRSTMIPRAQSMPDANRRIHLSQSDSAAMRSTAEAAKGLLPKTKKHQGGDDKDDDAEGVQNARLPRNRSVVFGNLEIREYARTIGCNPSVSGGPPVGLDWSYDPNERIAPIEAFESVRIRRNLLCAVSPNESLLVVFQNSTRSIGLPTETESSAVIYFAVVSKDPGQPKSSAGKG